MTDWAGAREKQLLTNSDAMNTFNEVFSFVAAICTGIMALAVFFNVLGFVKARARGFDVVKLRGFIKDGKLVNVHLSGGVAYRGVRFVGFTDQNSAKGGVPFQLSQKVVCETVKGARIMFRPETVRIIEEIEVET